jgi:hypothetical protein
VPERVVDLLHPVKIEVHDQEPVTGLVATGSVELVEEVRPVGQAAERVGDGLLSHQLSQRLEQARRGQPMDFRARPHDEYVVIAALVVASSHPLTGMGDRRVRRHVSGFQSVTRATGIFSHNARPYPNGPDISCANACRPIMPMRSSSGPRHTAGVVAPEPLSNSTQGNRPLQMPPGGPVSPTVATGSP